MFCWTLSGMDKNVYLLGLLIGFFALLITPDVASDGNLIDSDLSVINSSVWNDVPLEMDDKNPIVLIAKPFIEVNVRTNETTVTTPLSHNNSRVNFNKTDDFFARNIFNVDPKDLTSPKANASSPYETRFSNKFSHFRKKFFSKFLSL